MEDIKFYEDGKIITNGKVCHIYSDCMKKRKPVNAPALIIYELTDKDQPTTPADISSLRAKIQRLTKLMRGMNGLFGLVVRITIGETMLAGIATATAAVFFLSPLPASPSIPPHISGQVMTATDNTDLEKLQQRLTTAVHKLKELHEVHMKPEIIQGQFGPRIGGNNTDDSDDDQGDIELSFGNKDTFVLEDEPIAVEDHISRDSSSVTLSQPGKESTLIQELNSEKSKNQALDLQLQNQIHLIQKLKSEKDTLSLSLQKKDKDIQVLSEKLQDRLPQSGTCSVEWRSKIMLPLSNIFAKERDVPPLSELHSSVPPDGDGAMALTDIQRLENKIQTQSQAVDEQGRSFFESSLSVDIMKWEQEGTSPELALQKAEKETEQLQRNLCLERSHGLAASGTSPWVADKELVRSLYRKYRPRFRTPSVLEKIKDSKHVQSLYRKYKPKYSMQRSASVSSSTTSGSSDLTSNSSA